MKGVCWRSCSSLLQGLLDLQPPAEPVAEGAAHAHPALRVPRGCDRPERVRGRGVRGGPREHRLLDPSPRDLRLRAWAVAVGGERPRPSAPVPVYPVEARRRCGREAPRVGAPTVEGAHKRGHVRPGARRVEQNPPGA